MRIGLLHKPFFEHPQYSFRLISSKFSTVGRRTTADDFIPTVYVDKFKTGRVPLYSIFLERLRYFNSMETRWKTNYLWFGYWVLIFSFDQEFFVSMFVSSSKLNLNVNGLCLKNEIKENVAFKHDFTKNLGQSRFKHCEEELIYRKTVLSLPKKNVFP